MDFSLDKIVCNLVFKCLEAGKTCRIWSCVGNSFPPEMRGSFHCNEFSTPASVPYIHSESSLIFPFKTSPNNMTTFSCAPGHPYGELQATDFLSLLASYSKVSGLVWDSWNNASVARHPFVWDSPDGLPHFSCPNDHRYLLNPTRKPSDVIETEAASLIRIMMQMCALMGVWSTQWGTSQGWRHRVYFLGAAWF